MIYEERVKVAEKSPPTLGKVMMRCQITFGCDNAKLAIKIKRSILD